MTAPPITMLRRRLDALEVRGSVDSADYARTASSLLDTLEELIASGHAAEARPLARRSVELITIALMLLVDSSDAIGQACQRALGLFARACRAARPNTTKLAGWLLQLQLESPGWPAVDLADFAGALGDSGLLTYRTLVDEALHTPPEDSVDEAAIRRALTLLLIRERLDKFDRAEPVEPDDLPNTAAFLGVATGDHAPWLVEFLVQAYLDGGRVNDALELRRSELRARPTRDHYAKLKGTALHLSRWDEIRPWALDILHAGGSGDDVVGALLDDGSLDDAWEAAARHGCSPPLWLEVARQRAAHHPTDVLPGYRSLITEQAARAGRRAYREAAELLGELLELSRRCDRVGEFGEFVAELRDRHRRKTALLDELDRSGLGW